MHTEHLGSLHRSSQSSSRSSPDLLDMLSSSTRDYAGVNPVTCDKTQRQHEVRQEKTVGWHCSHFDYLLLNSSHNIPYSLQASLSISLALCHVANVVLWFISRLIKHPVHYLWQPKENKRKKKRRNKTRQAAMVGEKSRCSTGEGGIKKCVHAVCDTALLTTWLQGKGNAENDR